MRENYNYVRSISKRGNLAPQIIVHFNGLMLLASELIPRLTIRLTDNNGTISKFNKQLKAIASRVG